MPESADQLERHSLFLLGATLVGHVGNYLYHFITGRMLPESEYGLLMALFGGVNLLLLPMSALNLSLSRAVAALHAENRKNEISALLRIWFIRLTGVAGLFLMLSGGAYPFASRILEADRFAPFFLAACIPGINLLLTLTGAGLQGLQRFQALAVRGSALFVTRALLVGLCLTFGFRAAGWALIPHVAGMGIALGLSLAFLLPHLAPPAVRAQTRPVLRGSLSAFPVLLAFSALMTADVILIRALHPEALSGQFAQAATLGRMILWLPLPIAQVMFPKVVRGGDGTPAQRRTLFKALGYTLGLVGLTLAGAWIFAPLLFQILFGITPTPAQIGWLRGIALSMACLGPVYVVIHYELARDRIRLLLPLCALSAVYVLSAWFRNVTPEDLIRFLFVASVLSLFTAARALAAERVPPPAP